MGEGLVEIQAPQACVQVAQVKVSAGIAGVRRHGVAEDLSSVDHVTDQVTPSRFRLAQNSPNPFSTVTEIRYELPFDCHVTLEIWSAHGQKVAVLVDEVQKAGYKLARWESKAVASGIYFYRLQAGEFAETRKMILLRR